MTTAKAFRMAAVAGLGLLGAAGAALAAPQCPETLDPLADYKCVYIDVGTDKYGSGSKTDAFYELGLTGTLATSIYQASLALGSQVIDTNRTSVINSYGFTTGTYSNVSNTGNVAIKDTPTDPAEKNIDSLNPLGSGNIETQGLNATLSSPKGWKLTFDYTFIGTLTAGGPSFTSGDILFTYTDLETSASETVLRVNVTGSQLQAANLDIFGLISFDFDNNGSNDCTSTLCQGFWNFQTSVPPDWYSLNGMGIEIRFALDTNVNPPFPTLDQLTAGSNPANEYWARQTTLDSSIRFTEVPEPGSLALAGLALLGIAGAAARRSRKA